MKKILFVLLLFVQNILPQGEVYLVIGSDTAIWNGMNTGRYHCTYNDALYTDPTMNAYEIMNPEFRADKLDSYGTPLKMTWWMMAGNIFRYATNTDMPVPNIMTLYFMKKYHGENVEITGDELSLHYHTFFWSDYNQDGLYFWNQSRTFMECLDDFNVTLAQFLLEEHTFPVSFRSGWHYMDNGWQNYLDERVLPFSMHSAFPSKRLYDDEPIDNIYDWSQATRKFIPYHPSKDNYQVPGDLKGWDVRSISYGQTIAHNYVDTIFAAANKGVDQVACIWSHLPETDFNERTAAIHDLTQEAIQKYPNVKFRYCTGVEAMQRWLQTDDAVAPQITFTQEGNGDNVTFLIESDEHIFQDIPFVAIKTLNEEYRVLECTSIGENQWRTIDPINEAHLVKAGVTVCDTVGNQTMEFIEYLPPDAYLDSEDDAYTEVYGQWTDNDHSSWGTDSRTANVTESDSASAAWTYTVPMTTNYNIFVQMPDIDNRTPLIRYDVLLNDQIFETVTADYVLPSKEWIYLSTVDANEQDVLKIAINAKGENQQNQIAAADVIKITPMVKEKDLELSTTLIDFGAVSQEDSAGFELKVSNLGIQPMQITQVSFMSEFLSIDAEFPVILEPMESITTFLKLYSDDVRSIMDTLVIESDDPFEPMMRIPVTADVRPFFTAIDNEDELRYEELTNNWHTSVANIYGPTSRYAFLNENPLAVARFYTELKKPGRYKVEYIVPKTVNSTDDALYQLIYDNTVVAEYHVDQNAGSGDWKELGEYLLPANQEVELRIKDTGESTVSGVIRTDAVRFTLLEEITGIGETENNETITEYQLHQNYPNPFNPSTMISYQLPEAGHVRLTIYSLMGEEVRTLVDKNNSAGNHTVSWNGTNDNGIVVPAGVYFYRINAGEYTDTKKMMLLK